MARRRNARSAPPAAAAAVVKATPWPRRRGLWLVALLVLASAVAGVMWLSRAADPIGPPASLDSGTNPPRVHATAAPASAPEASPTATYVDNDQCLGCHKAEAEQWITSHHAMAMALPDRNSVRGNFDNSSFRHRGVTTRFFKLGDRFIVNTQGEDGRSADFEVRYTFGIEPLQQYLIETRDGRLQPLTIAWDTRKNRWFHLLPDERTPPGDVLHWTGRYQTGNTMCISCHTTGFEKRYDAQADRFDSRWSEVNVSCQSCHGPGSQHARWALDQAAGRGDTSRPADRGGFSKRAASAAGATVQMCAACHSRRAELTALPVPGQPQLDHYLPSLLREGLYHPDGQQLDEVYVDASFRQSKMFAKGVGCSDCHNPHTAKVKLPGNALCLQCHRAQANPAFPGAAGNFDTPAHHHHGEGSAGAQCVACHMPAKNYMQIQARPDHSMRVPRPDLSVAIGTPNACNQCHDDKPAQWAADAVTRWFGTKQRPPHFGEAFAAARSGSPGAGAGAALTSLLRDPAQPPVVRATAIELLRPLGDMALDLRIDATRDADGEVRATAAAGLDNLPASQRVPALAPLLRDPLRAVRIAAARSLASLPADQFDAKVRAAFDAALAEYVAAQEVSLDMPGSNLNLGALYEVTGRHDLVEQHYQRALKIDPDFAPARANLARWYSARSRNAEAETVLVDGLKRQPGLGELLYSLGLLLAEERRLPESAEALARAAKLMPNRARVHYNLGLAYQQTGQTQAAEAALLQAQRIDPADPAFPHALAVLYAQTGQAVEAVASAERLQRLRPGDPQAAQMLQQLRGAPR